MSGGKAARRKKQTWRKKYANGILRRLAAVCRNCGERGAHFVPPSLGDPGFYMCERKTDD